MNPFAEYRRNFNRLRISVDIPVPKNPNTINSEKNKNMYNRMKNKNYLYLCPAWQQVQINFIFTDNIYVCEIYFVYPAMSNSP